MYAMLRLQITVGKGPGYGQSHILDPCLITCQVVEVDEILKAAGGIGCATGILERETIVNLSGKERSR